MFPEIYEEPVWRPPSEARSLILQATIGCSWNRCTFCSMYRSKRFRIRTLEDLESDVEKVIPYYEGIDRVFLADGNALGIETEEMISILKMLYGRFDSLKRVTTYAGPRDLKEKSVDELRALKDAGLTMVYLGLESGSDKVLRKVRKGANPEMMIDGAHKLKEAGIELSTIFILGLGGAELTEEHARETARIVSKQDPEYAAALTLMIDPGSEIEEEVGQGMLTPLDPEGILMELRSIVSGIEVSKCVFRANHASNYRAIGGILPRDRDAILMQIEEALRSGSFRSDIMRRL